MTTPTRPPIQPQQALPRSMPPHAGAPEASTWSTRSAASVNDVDTDQHRHTLGSEEGPLSDPGTHPDHVHNADLRSLKFAQHRSSCLLTSLTHVCTARVLMSARLGP